MSSSFRLQYLFGLIPTAQKIDSAWTELFKMRNELNLIETSKELARYRELKQLVQSGEFQTKKREIVNLKFSESDESKLLSELAKLEHSKPIKDYFKFIESPEFYRLNKISESSELARYYELEKIVGMPDFILRKKETESLQYKGSPEYIKRQENNALLKNSRLQNYYATITTDEYRIFLELDKSEKERLNEHSKRKDPKVFLYHKFLKSGDYKNFIKVESLGLPAKLEQLKKETSTKAFLEREAFLKNTARYETTPDFPLFNEFKTLSKKYEKVDYFKPLGSIFRSKSVKATESPELKRYIELKTIVSSPDFIQRKKETESLRYKGTPEYAKRQELNALQNSSKLKGYFATIASEEYRVFLELDASEKKRAEETAIRAKDPKVIVYQKFVKSSAFKNLVKVENLGLPAKMEKSKQETNAKSFIDREAFLLNKARYETTADYPKFDEFTRLSKSNDVIFYLKSIKSSIYINYQKIEKSTELARLKQLRLLVADPKFIQQVAFLKNKKRYELTDGHKTETEFNELDKSDLLKTYRLLVKKPELAFFDKWDVVLDENFSGQQLSSKLWEPENYWGSKMAGYSFSQANELQAYRGLKNIEIRNTVLSIVTKAEKTEGRVWDSSIGLIPRKFDYSSAILNSGNGFKFSEGVVEAKVKFRADKAITSAFSLTGSKPFPQIDVFRSGNNSVGVGIIDHPGAGGTKKLVQIKGLNFNEFHIFRLEVFGNQMIWKINNHEVHREQVSKNLGELFLNFIGSLHQPINGTPLPHHFEIDWVRCLKKK